MKLTRIGHANVLLEGSKTIIIDPFFIDNPVAAFSLEQTPKVDYVLVTHDHFDHFGQAIEIAKRDKAKLIIIHEVGLRDDVKTADIEVIDMNIGGTIEESEVTISMTPAVHSARHGSPAGFMVNIDGKTVYHAGDTALFLDMQLIPGLFGDIDIALLPIGGHYTMNSAAAAQAVQLLQPKKVIPIHYNTWPAIVANTEDFIKQCQAQTEVVVLNPGESHQA